MTQKTKRARKQTVVSALKSTAKRDAHSDPRRWFYEKNKKLLEHPVNKKFEEVLWMSEAEFAEWMEELRRVVVQLWDDEGVPPVVGLDEDDIVDQFSRIESFPVSTLLTEQLGAIRHKAIVNNAKIGSAANQWFPTMLKTKINYTSNLKAGLSIYDHFSDDEYLGKMITYGTRHFKRDSFYNYSQPVPCKAADTARFLFGCATGKQWISKFEAQAKTLRKKYDYWLEPKARKVNYTGYSKTLKEAQFLTISEDELKLLHIPAQCKTNISKKKKATEYQIRLFEKGQRLFPAGYTAFRVSLCQSAVNFPPLTAKFLYERYLNKLGVKEAIIWDPSAGWGGRILGAMGISRDFQIHYIGTDPNTAHNTENDRTKYHELADFYNEVRIGKRRAGKKRRRLPTSTNTYEIFQCGSEDMSEQPGFKQYKGRIDIVFTSPPYFGKEIYSEDEKQSAIKNSEYQDWRKNFLEPTLRTAFEWLKPGGYLIWNIANIRLGKITHRLEDHSCRFLYDLGMERVEILKMALGNMPGANRLDASEGPPSEEFITDATGTRRVIRKRAKIKAPHGFYLEGSESEKPQKYEPIFVYRKPIKCEQNAAKTRKRSKAAVETDPMEFATIAAKLAADFCRAIGERKINPHWLRAIYTGLEREMADKPGITLSKHFNKARKNALFISDTVIDGCNFDVPTFVQRKVANRSTRQLAGASVLVQFSERDRRGNIKRNFSIGEVLKPQYGDSPQSVWVKISEKAMCCEKYKGLTLEVRKWDVFELQSEPAPFSLIKGEWHY